ncbi:22471_t:CDS:2 [Dentiscutata erythropus]|uniref:22471_t:CDS:1 n=1 Tax=Dentiscutata erythropus TaxID=1348616 RepID=A0A9N9JD98_9GLOM|nr:22471_t:CDS:2 [Dentiscutata erythropus]
MRGKAITKDNSERSALHKRKDDNSTVKNIKRQRNNLIEDEEMSGELSEEEGKPKSKNTYLLKKLRPEYQLKLQETFEDQCNLVKISILLRITNALDKTTFPVVDSVIYKILHQLHRHQRDEFITEQKLAIVVDKYKRRKHNNGHKRKRRAKTIDHLSEVNDKLIRKIAKKGLMKLQTSNHYHSPEISETDEESVKRKIVVYNLKWQSQALKELLRNYMDKINDEMVKVKPFRIRSHGPGFASEDKPPINAPKWILAKYETETVEEENEVDEEDEVESEGEVDEEENEVDEEENKDDEDDEGEAS